MKPLALVLLLCVVAVGAETPPTDGPGRLLAFYTETIPALQLKDATFEEALATVRRAWEQRFPGAMFPVALTDFQARERVQDVPDSPRITMPRITMDLKNIPFAEAIRYLAALTNRKFVQRPGFLAIRNKWEDEEDWTIRSHDVTAKALAGLQLKPDSPGPDVRKAFAGLGFDVEEWTFLALYRDPNQQWLIARCKREQQEQIAGILFLLDKGFKITK